MGVAFFCALDLALLAWDDYASDPYKARSHGQHVTAMTMIIINVVGILLAMIADSARIVDPTGSKDLIRIVSIFGIAIFAIANLSGMLAVHQMDPDRAEQQAEAEHQRKLARMRAKHDRDLEMQDRETELAIARFNNDKRIKTARQHYFIDSNGDGIPDKQVDAPMLVMAADGHDPKSKKG